MVRVGVVVVFALIACAADAQGQCVVDGPFDYWGADVGGADAANVGECCSLCTAEPKCSFFTFMLDKKHCLFKANRGDRRPSKSRVSGARPGGPPPPPSLPDFGHSCTANLTGVGPRLPFAFCNASLPEQARLDDLLARLSDYELCAVLQSRGYAVPRLGLPALRSSEDTHGVSSGCGAATNSSTGCPTSFPAGPALGASFDTDLWDEIGGVIGREARALSNQNGVAALYFLDPNINLLRDPRWGRAQEVPGECPVLTSEYAAHIINATQRSEAEPRYLQAASTAKHFSMYDMEGYLPRTDPQPHPPSGRCETPGGCERWNFDMRPPMDQFVAFYLPPFRAAVERAGVAALMCSYNSAFGLPTCANDALNNGLVRGNWSWDGFFISDCTALELFQDVKWDNCAHPWPSEGGPECVPDPFPGGHNYTHTVADTVRAALVQGGIDYNCGSLYKVQLAAALRNGTVSRAEVEVAARRVFRTMLRLGMLDPLDDQPLLQIPPSEVDGPRSRAIALRAAREGIVLLKNTGGVLPLDAAATKIAFIGPHANSTQALISNYHGTNKLVDSHSPLQAATAAGLNVTYARGCNICDVVPPGFPNMPCPPGKASDKSMIAAAVEVAKAADAAVVFVGSDQTTEAENFDRVDIALAGVQEQLIEAVVAAQPRTAVVLINGGPIAYDGASNRGAPAILEAFYPGELGGDAIVDVLTGAVNPTGRLPYTIYPRNFTGRDVRITDLAAEGGVTYQYYKGTPLFEFGHGLSYTTFDFAWHGDAAVHAGAAASPLAFDTRALSAAPPATYMVTVTNTGTRAGGCVVLAFVRSLAGAAHAAGVRNKELFGFARVDDIAPGASRHVSIRAPAAGMHLSSVTRDGRRQLLPGRLQLEVGVGSADASVLKREVVLTGPAVVLEANEWVAAL